MNRNVLVIIIVLSFIAAALLFAFSGEKEEANILPASSPTPTSSLTPEEEAELETMIDEHMGEHGDDTIMAMAGRMTPAVFYASPGQVISLLNHEAESLKIVAVDGSFESPLVTTEAEITTFNAPTKIGTYNYYSSLDSSVKGIIVVEE